ncbi:Pleiotropic drug resistance protein 1 [Vitis vinifera]|uniref:Pleiotropic drug resistance protein 1 n=1 Tax=Vitis vinifera TaxID=29760 RepID=A0A438CZS5_VITVI|nr:Pleiotropic drug resistance protein 1 [Vitis vinifera]
MATGEIYRAGGSLRKDSSSIWRNSGEEEKKNLVERLVKIAEEDNEKFLLKLRNRIDRVGIDLPEIEVRFEHLTIDAEAHVGSRALPSFINSAFNQIEDILNTLRILPSRKKKFTILHDVSGIIKPRRMTLLLGPPSSGKTTLLLALSGKLDSSLKVTGKVTYNGHGMNEFVPQRTATYISQHDTHIGEMTVRETLAFSARCQGVGDRYDMLAELSRREKAANIKPDPDIDVFMKAAATEGQKENVITDYTLKILGLEVCADTLVGDQMIRGISGGQRKRVTTGEMLVGPSKALFMDEISTGLDSSTTYQIVNSLRQTIHILNGTALISLLQPAPETYDLFDDIILLSDSQIVYQGPREDVLDFFESMGFRCPERKGVADFLQEWTELGDELATPFDKTKSHPAALKTEKYGVRKKELLDACISREYWLMKRNSFVYILQLTQLIIMAAISMTIFLRTEMHKNSTDDGSIYMGALFFTVVMIMFNGMSELAMTIAKLPVFYKQRGLLFYPAWAYALSSWILKIPSHLLKLLFGCSCLIMSLDLIQMWEAAGRNMIVANTFGSFSLLLLFALGGFVLSRENVKKWWIWGYWSSPLMYAQNAIVVNEFLGKSWSKNSSTNSTESLGVAVLKSRGFFTEAYWYWIGAGALLGFILVFNFCYTVALTYLNAFEKPQAVITEESENSKTGGKIELSSHRRGSIDQTASTERDEIGRSISSTSSSVRAEAIAEARRNTKRGMVLPFQPLSITFDDIRYSVDMPEEMKSQGVLEDRLKLLKGVSGAFRPGVLTALMGVSGAGKTTLMDVLAGRKTGGYIEGNINISGYPKKQETFARISGYCEQNDIHSPHVTIHESLLYSAWLRLPADVDSKTRKIRFKFGLNFTLGKGAGSNLVDLESKLMFIEKVMELVELAPLKDSLVGLPGVNGLSTEQRKRLTIAVELVANPSIIFMDEPTSGLDARAAAIVMRTVRNTVDTGRTVLLLLKRGGQEIYVGLLGRHSSRLIKYFEGIEGVSKIKGGYNPATWMLEVTTSAQEFLLGVDFTEIYKNSNLYRRNKDLIKELSQPAPGSKDLYFPTQYSQSFFTQCMACLWKQRRSYWRNPPYTAVRFFFTTFIALIFGTMFWDLGTKRTKQQDLSNAMGSIERAAGMYSAMPYAFAQALVEIPYVFAQAVVYGVIVYAMIGFEWTAASSSAFYGLWNLFSGFIVPRTRIPVWWRWYYWACPVAWTLYGLVTSQFGDIEDTVLDSNVTVKQYLDDYFGFKHDFLGVVAVVIVGFTVLFLFIFAYAIKAFNFQRRLLESIHSSAMSR